MCGTVYAIKISTDPPTVPTKPKTKITKKKKKQVLNHLELDRSLEIPHVQEIQEFVSYLEVVKKYFT